MRKEGDKMSGYGEVGGYGGRGCGERECGGYGGYGERECCERGRGSSFALIVVLFILLIIVGAIFFHGREY
jgi:uncharacterized protein (TIGR01732 family)